LFCVMSWTLVSYYCEVRAGQWLHALDGDRATHLAQRAWHLDHGNWYAAETVGEALQFRARWGQDLRQRKADADGAVHWFDLAAQGNGFNMASRHLLGLSLITVGRSEEGLQQLRKAADTNPMNVEFRAQLGLQLRLVGRYAEALAEFHKANALQGNPMIDANLKWLGQQMEKEKRKL